MVSVVTTGELLVEIMRTETDAPFTEAGTFAGPFPSGAPGIFADAVSRLGPSAGIVAGVGDDGFGRCVLDRLQRDGVDTAAVRVSERLATGVAFVTYSADGSRQFIYHMANAASGTIGPDDVPRSTVARADIVHVNGSSLLMNESMREACYEMVDIAGNEGALVSFDPNIRPELLRGGDDREVLEPVVEHTNVLIPTCEELAELAGVETPETAAGADAFLDEGVSMIAVTKGADGCSLYTSSGSVHHEGFPADVVDPTGAGDAFAAAVVVGTLEGMDIEQLAAFANAVGAHAVTAQGPMEGVPTRNAIDEFLDT